MITKEIVIDQIEIVGEQRNVQIRTATVIKEDGVEISRSFHRRVLDVFSDITNEAPEIKSICGAVRTPEAIAAATEIKNRNV
ncbi:MAG: hypothetical protein O2887_10300 [Bacteroidetes bacterium]|nr:hypothetical protein [Bacteroidota bacterium]